MLSKGYYFCLHWILEVHAGQTLTKMKHLILQVLISLTKTSQF